MHMSEWNEMYFNADLRDSHKLLDNKSLLEKAYIVRIHFFPISSH